MSIPSFPSLTGISWPVTRSPVMNTIRQKPISGKETRLQLWTYPRYKWTLGFDVLPAGQGSGFLSNSDFQTLVGFFNSVAGSALPFHWTDPYDNAVTAGTIGTGDGTTTQFNFIRSFGGFFEPIQDVTQGSVTIYNNGIAVSPSAYTFLTDANWGLTYGIQFNTAPANGHALTATFTYNWPCRFEDDTYDFENFVTNLYALKKLSFSSVKVL